MPPFNSRDPGTAPFRALERDPEFPGLPKEFVDVWRQFGARFINGMTCPPDWWDHDRQEFRLGTVAETVVFQKQVLIPKSMQLDGFWLRVQTPYTQLYNNILTTNGAQAPLLTLRVRVGTKVINRNFVASRNGGEWWVPACVKTQDVIEVLATCTSAGQISNSPIRIRTEVSVGAELPFLDPFDERRNTVRTFAVTLAAAPLVVPTRLIGPASIFVATIPNAPWFIVPGSLKVNVVAGGAQVFIHGMSVAGVPDAGGQPILTGLPEQVETDRLDNIFITKPAAAAATLSIRFTDYD